LRRTNDNVFTSLAPPASLVEHLEGFANSGCIAEENLQSPATTPALLELDLCEQLLGVGSSR
jgi:hypothetical protein